MNANKTLGFFATVLTALACLVPTTAKALGDIRSIEVVKNGRDYEAEPMRAGEKITIKVRLMNRNWPLVWNSNGEVTNPWRLEYVGLGDPAVARTAAWPKLGLWISGGLRFAEMKENSPQLYTEFRGRTKDLGPTPGYYYTELEFVYTAQEGDFAMPIQLANSSGTGPVKGGGKESGGESGVNYYVENMYDKSSTPQWRLYETNSNATCEFYYGPNPYVDQCGSGMNPYSAWYDPRGETPLENWDLDLSGAKVCVRAADLETSYADEGNDIWRGIQKGTSAATPMLPAFEIRGGAPEPMTLWYWCEDEGIAEPADGVESFTFAEYNPSTGMSTGSTKERKVGKVAIMPGVETTTFRVKAVGETNQTTKVYMSLNAPTNTFDFVGKVLQNFLVRTVKVIEPPPPTITVTVAPKDVSTSSDISRSVSLLDVELSQPYTEKLTVELVPTMKSGSGTDPFSYIGMATSDEGEWEKRVTSVEIPAGETKPVMPLFIYANRADDDTSGAGKGILFSPKVTGAAASVYTSENWKGATLTIGTSKPKILSPVDGTLVEEVLGNEPHTYDIEIADAAGNLTNSYTVIWYNNGGSTVSGTYSNLTARTVDGTPNVLQVTHVIGNTSDDVKTYNSTFKIVNSDGIPSDVRSIKVSVLPKKKVTATTSPVGDAFDEGTSIDVDFKFNETLQEPDVAYVFLVPLDEATSNLVSNSAAEIGLKILKEKDKPSGKANLVLLDGFNGCYARFRIDVRTAEKINEGELLSEWSGELSFGINNVVPNVMTVYMSDRPLSESGKTITSTAAIGVTKRFRLDTDEPSDQDLVSTNFMAQWSFQDGNNTFVTNVYGSPFKQVVPYTFNNSGTNLVTVKLRDKDMTDQQFARVKGFSFYVPTLSTPAIELMPHNGSTLFTESQTGATKGRIDIMLTDAPSKPITVKIDVEKIGSATADNYPIPEINTYYVDIKSGSQSGYFYLSDIDGTKMTESKGFRFSAAVTNETANDDGVAWKDLYLPETLEIQIQNENPVIAGVATTNETLVAANVPFTIPWAVSDIDADLTNGMVAVWTTSEGVNVTYNGDAAVEGTFTNQFTSAGHKTVSLTVKDKDGGSDSRVYYYYVSPSKGLYIYPQGPKNSGQSTLTSSYLSSAQAAGGLGKGRAAADGELSSVDAFVHLWNYAPEKSEAKAWAWGYRLPAGETSVKDNGKLGTRDTPLKPTGDSFVKGTTIPAADTDSFYKYVNMARKESFFYAWVIGSKENAETGSFPEGTANVKPYDGTSSFDAEQMVTLAEYENDAVSYVSVILEPIFALEKYPEDNLGDINQDGIPDIDAVAKRSGGYLYQLASGGEGTQEEGGSLNDFVDVSAYNGADTAGDFWPVCAKTLNSKSWASGRPFTALDEIRGIHSGLNRRSNEGGMISDISLSVAERYALECAFQEAKGKGATTLATADEYMKAGLWTPENPTDPTIPDTDNDGIPDGIEYWIWYQATVGDVDSTTGRWKRMTGSRFSLDTIGQGEEIPSDVLAYAFNPNVKRDTSGMMVALDRFGAPILRADGTPWTFDGADFDNDGLLDVEEVLLGTNPASWDTDGDGISDFWEVMNELDPLDASDGMRGLGYKDARNNPDGDFMAWKDGPAVHVVTLIKDGKTTQWAFEKDPVLTAAEETETVVVLESGKDVFYAFEAEPAVAEINRATVLAGPTLGWTVLVSGEDKFLGAKVVVPAGTPIKLAGEDAAETPYAKLDATEGLQVFAYGPATDNYYVPCSQDGSTLAEIAEGMTVVAITAWDADNEDKNPHLVYIHNQVYWMDEFDPRTAWFDDGFGYVAGRWHSGNEGESGKAINTAAFTSLDEYLLLRYRYEIKATDEDNGFRASRDLASDKAGWPENRVTIFWGGMTTEQDLGGTTIPCFESVKTNSTGKSMSVYGADSDGDGVPDGWELYVNIDPNNAFDAPLTLLSGEDDKDGLSFVDEFAGTDSCNAYSNVPSIYQNHPGLKKGWYNKFFPTNPYSPDTDEDGITDANEGGSWKAEFWVGRSYYELNHTFVYGTVVDDFKSCCFVGGGLNPCTVDTDQDLLPDPWEYEFSGVVVSNGASTVEGMTAADFKQINASDGVWTPHGDSYIAGGMDGTWSGDPNCDFDHDGLMNYQEYLVQALRHLRYDDSETPLMGRELVDGELSPFIKFLPMQTWDAEDFYKRCREAGFSGGTSYEYRKLGYFARPPKAWDRLFCNKSMNAQLCVAYGDAMNGDDPRNGFRIMLRPHGLMNDGKRFSPNWGGYVSTELRGYASTDPRRWDSDDDGMDDYYELFHGLNPLLGSAADPHTLDVARQPSWVKYDRIAMIYGGQMDAWNNAWTGWKSDAFAVEWGMEIPMFDAMKYPWMMGTAEADADGDGVRNSEEALMVNIVKPSTTHTDPTPLWYTDSTSTNNASFVAQYYCIDPYIKDSDRPQLASGHLYYPWLWNTMTVKKSFMVDGSSLDWMFAFEENEGYDTDHDFMSDGDEIVRNVTPASDPLNAMDPDRRQALYFPAAPFSAAVTRSGACAHGHSADADILRQFTVEAWVLPEQRDDGVEQIILERVSVYGASTLSNNTEIIRANFRIGLTADGYPFAEFDGTTADAKSQRLVSERPLTWGQWEHLAFTFDGATASLYQGDSALPVARAGNVQLIPANGVVMYDQDPLELNKNLLSANNFMGYMTVPTAFILGARAVTPAAIKLSSESTEDAFTSCFRGYVDEVRVWDGARTSNEITTDCAKRYTWDDLLANRDRVFKAWKQGARRTTTLSLGTLPAELIQHYSFQTLPSEVNANNVLKTPLGFSQKVTDNVRIDGDYVPGGLFVGWWASLPLASSVYWDRTFVPWINNNVRHLPTLEGTTPDSWYWTHTSAGILTTNDAVVAAFAFPNSANPYGDTCFSYERYNHMFRLYAGMTGTTDVNSMTTEELIINGYSHDKLVYEDQMSRWAFDMRANFVGTEDIVPLGGAFAKRIGKAKGGEPGMWDGQGASDAWEYSVVDTDLDGLPDWWEKYASGSATGVDPDEIGKWTNWTALGNMTAREAYLRDLAKGLLPAFSPTLNDLYANKKDADFDGLPDWWQNIYGLDGKADDDQDGDQLSNRSEFRISEGFAQKYGFPRVDPEQASTFADQLVPDYFLRKGQMYLGEMFQDHDFMEDAWERLYGPTVSQAIYDPWNDPDNDGWSNFAECRAATDPTMPGTVGIDGISVAMHPTPVIHATVTYNGRRVLNAPLVVQAWGPNADRIPDAEWTVGAGVQNTKYVGRNPTDERKYVLDGGKIEPGSVGIEFKSPVWYHLGEEGKGIVYEYMTAETPWNIVCRDYVSPEDETIGIIFANGDIDNRIGTVNYQTGEATIDFAKLPEVYQQASGGDSGSATIYPLQNAFLRVFWSASFANGMTRQTVDLVEASSETVRETRGYVREGKNTFVAFLDCGVSSGTGTSGGGDGVWTPGEPYGIVSGVDVGWSEASIAIELTDTAPQTFRLDLGAALTDYSWDSVQAANDRGVNGMPNGENVMMPEEEVGTEMVSSLAQDYRMRIVRTKINTKPASGSGATTVYANEVVLDKYVNASLNPVFSEFDIVRETGRFDLDWDQLNAKAKALGFTDSTAVTSVTYRVVFGEGSVGPLATNNNLGVLFVNRFESGAPGTQTACKPVTQAGIVFSGRPTFRWTHENTANKSYPAFRMQIFKDDKKTLIWDSGIRQAPPRSVAGVYEFSPAFYCGSATRKGYVVTPTNNYYWAVSMLDAKFTTVNKDPEMRVFRLNTTGDVTDEKGYGSIKVQVKYMGPLASDATGRNQVRFEPKPNNITNVIHVQAFTSPDFTGDPVGQAYVTTVKDLYSSNALPVNAIITGVPEGTYYVRAFLDTDGNSVWSQWESWGYGCWVGDDNAANANVSRGGIAEAGAASTYIYTPRPYVVKKYVSAPTALVYIEDCDTDFDGLPDSWERFTKGSLTSLDPICGNTFFATVNPDLKATLNAYSKLGESLTTDETSALGIRLMSAMSGTGPEAVQTAQMASLMFDNAPMTEKTAVVISSFSMEAGIELTVENVTSIGKSDYLVVSDTADVEVVLVSADTLDFSNAKETVIKTVTIFANDTTVKTITAEEMAAAKAVSGEAKYYKVKLQKK